MSLSWEAVRNGDTYCAPACGAGCTWKEFQRVTKLAKALAEKCNKEVGGEWETNIHENLGWFYSVTLKEGNITIYERQGQYSIGSHRGGTPSLVYLGLHSDSIKELVDKQLELIQEEADKWNSYLKINRKALNERVI